MIIATIRSAEYERFQPTDQLRPPEWDVLRQFKLIPLARELTEDEEVRLDAAVANPEIQAQIRQIGIGEYAGAAKTIADKLALGAGVGLALVLGAADWRRCGLTRPVPEALLPGLARPHLDDRGLARLADPAAYAQGLAWAVTDINAHVSLLQPAGPGGYAVYDYALDLIARQGQPVPDTAWEIVVGQASPAELGSVGYAAYVDHRLKIAEAVWRKAATSGDADAAPEAAFALGDMLQERGDREGAPAAYRLAIDTGHSDAAPQAAVNLGNMLGQEGDQEGARAAWQLAIDSGHAKYAPEAARMLKELDQNEEGS